MGTIEVFFGDIYDVNKLNSVYIYLKDTATYNF